MGVTEQRAQRRRGGGVPPRVLEDGLQQREKGRVGRRRSLSFFNLELLALGLRLPLNAPPTGRLNRPLINPSVGSLLRPRPSEEGSGPTKQAERGGAGRGGRTESRSGFSFVLL